MRVLALVAFLGVSPILAAREAPEPPVISAFRLRENPDVKHAVPLEMIRKGIPVPDPRDRIRSIDEPRFTDAKAARWLDGDERVLGVAIGEEARAYPLRILDRHEIVNDRIGTRAIAVTW